MEILFLAPSALGLIDVFRVIPPKFAFAHTHTSFPERLSFHYPKPKSVNFLINICHEGESERGVKSYLMLFSHLSLSFYGSHQGLLIIAYLLTDKLEPDNARFKINTVELKPDIDKFKLDLALPAGSKVQSTGSNFTPTG